MAAIKYTCYRDATDLTELVERTLNPDKTYASVPAVMGITGPSRPDMYDLEDTDIAVYTSDAADRPKGVGDSGWEIGVECPKDGCRNIFSSQTLNHATGDEQLTIVGRPSTDMDAYLSNAAKELGPDKSLTRVSDSARYVIANVSLVALVAGGFGIFSNAKGGFDDHPVLFGAIVAMAVTALITAVVGLLPRTKGNLNSNNLVEVADAYRSTIAYRILWARISTGALVIALLLGCAVFLVSNSVSRTSAISATWDGSGGRLLVDATVTSEKLPDGAHVTVALTNPTAPEMALGTITSKTGKDGTAKSEIKIPLPAKMTRVAVTATTAWGKQTKKGYEHERVDKVLLTPPPFTPPAK